MPRRRSVLDGMDLNTLQAQLTTLQTAYLAVSAGGKSESVSYTQGEGSKAVTYTRASIPSLQNAIRLVQRQIDIITGNRGTDGPIKPYFG